MLGDVFDMERIGAARQALVANFPWYEREHLPAEEPAQLPLFGGQGRPVTRFHSGSSAYWDFRGFVLAGVPVGITATELPRRAAERFLRLVVDYVDRGSRVFVDSGAFGAFVAGRRVDFESKVFPIYDDLLSRCGRPECLHLVMPDVVGDPQASLGLQVEYAGLIRTWLSSGAQCIFPLHSPNDARFLAGIHGIAAGYTPTIGVPSNLESWSLPELVRFCEPHQPARLHLLGLGQPRKVRAISAAVTDVSPGTEMSCDSCTLLAHVGHGRRLTDRCRTRLADAVRWVMDDPGAKVPYPDLGTYVSDLLFVPNFLPDADVRSLAARFSLDPEPLLEAGKTLGLAEVLGTLDPDETWFHHERCVFVRGELLQPKLERILRGPIRAWEVARLAGMAEQDCEEDLA